MKVSHRLLKIMSCKKYEEKQSKLWTQKENIKGKHSCPWRWWNIVNRLYKKETLTLISILDIVSRKRIFELKVREEILESRTEA